MMDPIGGFFQLQLPDIAPNEHTIATHWQISDGLLLQNARSCFYYLIQHINPIQVWLPAYVCKELTDAVPNEKLRYFPVDEQLSPDIDYLRDNIQAKDMVLAVNYFGRPPNDAFLSFVKQHPNIHWIEDRAHTLSTEKSWGDWLLYSPRKLLGVSDGGILVANNAAPIPDLNSEMPQTFEHIIPAWMRMEDKKQQNNVIWYFHYQKSEMLHGITNTAMSQLTFWQLNQLNLNMLTEKRLINYQVLSNKLKDCSFIKDDVKFIPMGFPIRVKNRDEICRQLMTKRIFAAKHWINLPSDPAHFPIAHQLSNELLTLPCDHRYDKSHMEFISDSLEELL